MKRLQEIVDKYLFYALLIDTIIVILLWILNTHVNLFDFNYNEKSNNLDIINNIIGTSVSLAGFILASLTIIVAIRSSISTKKPEEATTPMELFFSIGTYKTIVKVYKIAITELVICFIVGYITWAISANISNEIIFKIIVILIYLMVASTVRGLLVLFLLISAEHKKTTKAE